MQISEVQELELAPVDAALFSQYGLEEGTEEDFRAEVKQNMERELRNAIEASVKNQVMDAIVAAHENLEMPASLISQEVSAMRSKCSSSLVGRHRRIWISPQYCRMKCFLTSRAPRQARAGGLRNDQTVRADR